MKSARIKDYRVSFENNKEFHVLRREIFGEHLYYVELDPTSPRLRGAGSPYIIDAGAYIGLTTLYFKMLYPGAEVLSIEPNPEVVPILEQNIFENQLEGVRVEQVALGTEVGMADFFMDKSEDRWYSTAGFIDGAWNKGQYSRSIKVQTQPLSVYLDREVDLLKMDIEGAEMRVLMKAGERIRKVGRMLIEFHGVGENSLPRIVEFLEEQGFGVEVRKAGVRVNADKIEKVTGLAMVEGVRK